MTRAVSLSAACPASCRAGARSGSGSGPRGILAEAPVAAVADADQFPAEQTLHGIRRARGGGIGEVTGGDCRVEALKRLAEGVEFGEGGSEVELPAGRVGVAFDVAPDVLHGRPVVEG